jgi:hypothetical protein
MVRGRLWQRQTKVLRRNKKLLIRLRWQILVGFEQLCCSRRKCTSGLGTIDGGIYFGQKVSLLRQHLNQLLLTIDKIVSNELHRSRLRRVIEPQNRSLGRFMKRTSSGEGYSSFTLDLQDSRPLSDITNHWARMKMPPRRLPWLKDNLANFHR